MVQFGEFGSGFSNYFNISISESGSEKDNYQVENDEFFLPMCLTIFLIFLVMQSDCDIEPTRNMRL